MKVYDGIMQGLQEAIAYNEGKAKMRKTVVKGIIFDKDGTLMDYASFWVPIAEKAVEYILKKVGGKTELKAKMLEASGAYLGMQGLLRAGTYGQISDTFYVMLAKSGIKVERAELNQITRQAFHESRGVGKILPTCDEIREVILALKKIVKVLALVTSDDAYMTEQCLKNLGIHDLFDRIYADDGIHPSKPDPYYIKLLCKEEGMKPEELVMVGDTPADMAFAENGGVIGIGVAKNAEDKKILMEKATFVIDDISGVKEIIEGI